jgi:hypothetical protein
MPLIFVMFLPLTIWYFTPDAWHGVLAAVAIVSAVVFGIFYAYSVRRWHANEAATSAAKEEYRWLSGWDAARYERHFGSFLRFRGWRILSSSAPGPGRITVVAEKDRCRLALLCVEPSQYSAAADLSHLELVGREVKATRIALVSRPNNRPASLGTGAAPMLWQIRYDDLPRLEELLRLYD